VFDDCRDDAVDLDWDCAVVVEDNTIRNCRDDGLEIRLYPYEGEEPLMIVVHGNTITGSGEDGIQIIDHDGPSHRVLRIEHNLISGTAKAAVGCMDGGQTGEDFRAAAIPDKIYIVNNTFLDNCYGISGGGSLAVVNNVFVRTEEAAIKRAAAGATVTHNLFWRNGREFEDCGADSGKVIRADPLLDESGVPGPGSPCLGAGVSLFAFQAGRSGTAPHLGALPCAMRPHAEPPGTTP
jgi:hypothetical protein